MGQRTCPNCGTTNAQNASTCSWCGRSLDDDATQPLGRAVPPSGTEQRPGTGWPPPDAAPEEPSPGSWEAAPTQQQPSPGSWEAAPTQQQPSPGSWEAAPTQHEPSPGSWEAAPTQQQPSSGSWEPGAAPEQPRGGAWEPPSPAQPAAGSREAGATEWQPQGGAWEPGGEPPAGGWEPPGSPAQPPGGSWEPAPTQQQPSSGSWEPGGAQPPAGGGWQPAGGSWGYGQDAPVFGQQAGWGTPAAGRAQWGTAVPAAPRRRKPLLWAVLGVVVLVALVGFGIAAMNIGGTVRKVARSNQPLHAPADIGGFNRIDTGQIRTTLDQQSSQLRQKGAKNFVVAAYGTETEPQFVLVAVREANDKTRQDITTGFDQALKERNGGAGQAQTFRQDEVEYRCGSTQFGVAVAICRFDDGDVVGFGFSGTQTAQRVSQFTAEARGKMK